MQSYDFNTPSNPEGEFGALATPLREKRPPRVGRKKILVIAGPTATGKSDIALKMARLIKGEIISADSVQVYRGLDIGTAKVSQSERLEIPHHLIDICDLSEPFNAAQFYRLATEAIDAILARGHVPIVVGGTGFYIHALLFGPPQGPPSQPEVRQELEEQMEKFGHEALYDQLQKFDPLYASTITPGDRNKIIRALEIIKISKQRVSDFKLVSQPHAEKNYDFHCWFLYYPKDILYQRIEMRCDEMVSKGLLEEVKGLIPLGLRENNSASQAIGYRQTLEYIDSGEKDFEGFVAALKQASRRYAKRQFTWFKKEALFHWLDLHEVPPPEAINQILSEFESAL